MNAAKMTAAQLDAARAERAALDREILRLEEAARRTKGARGLDGWRGFTFQSSSGLTEEFAAFARDFRAWVKKNLPEGARLDTWSRGHFEVSGMIERGGRFVYFSTSDVRFFKDRWADDILIRTAKHNRDWTGGQNCRAGLDNFRDRVAHLLDVWVSA
jgi:hypothetical protein